MLNGLFAIAFDGVAFWLDCYGLDVIAACSIHNRGNFLELFCIEFMLECYHGTKKQALNLNKFMLKLFSRDINPTPNKSANSPRRTWSLLHQIASPTPLRNIHRKLDLKFPKLFESTPQLHPSHFSNTGKHCNKRVVITIPLNTGSHVYDKWKLVLRAALIYTYSPLLTNFLSPSAFRPTRKTETLNIIRAVSRRGCGTLCYFAFYSRPRVLLRVGSIGADGENVSINCCL